MPTLAETKIPPGESWSEFEEIACSALKIRWGTKSLQVHGTQGQGQHGVDIHGNDDIGREVGIQCRSVAKLTIEQIAAEVKKAEGFCGLEAFWVVTTLKRDARLFREVRALSDERRNAKQFPVGILFWNDLYQDLVTDPAVFAKHFPQFAPTTASAIPTDEKTRDLLRTKVGLQRAKACQDIYTMYAELDEGLPDWPDMDWGDVVEFVAWDLNDHDRELAGFLKKYGTILDDKLLKLVNEARGHAAMGKMGVRMIAKHGPEVSRDAADYADKFIATMKLAANRARNCMREITS